MPLSALIYIYYKGWTQAYRVDPLPLVLACTPIHFHGICNKCCRVVFDFRAGCLKHKIITA